MNIIISGKQMDLTDGIKNAIEEKLGRLDFYLHPATDVKVTVSAKKARQKVEVTIIPISGPIIRAEDIEENLYAAIDVVYDKLNKQLRKYKKRLQDRHQSNESIRFDAIEDIEENDYSSNEDNLDIVIKRTKKFGVKPMSPEEAVLQMDLSELDPHVVQLFPSHALAIAKNKILEMGSITVEACENVREYFISKSSTAKETVEELENAINLLDKKISEYLLLISHEQLNDHDSKEYFADMKSIKDLERVGDLCINLTQFFEAVYDEKDDFSSEAKDDIIAMINMDIEMLNHAMVAFDKHDLDDIIYVDDRESNLDYYNKKAKQRHIQRVTNKTEKSVIVNSTYVDILSNLERIGDHCQNIAESYMLEEENFKPDYEVDSAFNQ